MNFDTRNYSAFSQNVALPFFDSTFPNNIETQYLSLLDRVMREGFDMADRTGTGARELFGVQIRHNLNQGFPLLTTKQVFTKSIIHELLWFLAGDTNIKYLNDNGVNIWNQWADKSGNLGPVYGHQWRRWLTPEGEHIDQIADAINFIKNDPDSRRIILSAWNVADLGKMALMPCHVLFQFRVHAGKLSCQLYQRSSDLLLGVPYNIASYSLLTHMVAKVCGLGVGEFIWSSGSTHIYSNHFDQVKEQLSREQKPFPTLVLADRNSIDDFVFGDFVFEGYNHHPAIKAPIAV